MKKTSTKNYLKLLTKAIQELAILAPDQEARARRLKKKIEKYSLRAKR